MIRLLARVSHVLQPLLPPRPLLGRQVRGVVPLAPLKHGNAGGTSIAAEHDAPPSGVHVAKKKNASRSSLSQVTNSERHHAERGCPFTSFVPGSLRIAGGWVQCYHDATVSKHSQKKNIFSGKKQDERRGQEGSVEGSSKIGWQHSGQPGPRAARPWHQEACRT